MIKKNWHALKTKEIFNILKSNPEKGLTEKETIKRQKKYGFNITKEYKEKSAFYIFLLQFNQPLIYILNLSAILSVFIGSYVDASVIFGVVLLISIIGYIQENKASKAIAALTKKIKTHTTVLRDKKIKEISSYYLVPGDIVFLRTGDKIPADLRLIDTRSLKVDESMLTGESVSIRKQIKKLKDDTILADRSNMSYASTLVTHGQGKGIVTGTSNYTEVGKISQLIAKAITVETPLTKKIAKFSAFLLYVILFLSFITFLVGILRGYSAYYMTMACVALAVGAIPEGLPAAFTIILAIGVSKMAKNKAIIRKFPAVETLGSTTVICVDKTGTITKNEMTVSSIYTKDNYYKVTGVGYKPEGKIIGEKTKDLKEILKASILCNDAFLVNRQGEWLIKGDPTEGALIVASKKYGLLKEECETKFPRIDTLQFQSEYQYMATLHKNNIVYVKGSPEVILEKCKNKKEIVHAEKMAKEGLRVLAFAKKSLSAKSIRHRDINDLEFLGFIGMIDPPRDTAIESIAACQKAGIKVSMITGDHAITASYIAKKIKLKNPEKIMLGKEIEEYSMKKLKNKIKDISVFARVTPEQKLKLVYAFQELNEIVAMTGDGVNDAPALKRADIGIAMGKIGTDVAKEASDMVLLNDDFLSIKMAVEEGRGVFDNLKKFIVWTLPTNLGEGLVIFVAILLGSHIPILPVQILWINMTTSVFLGLMLVFEKKEKDIMQRSPRDPKKPILTRSIIERIFIVGIILLISSYGLFYYEIFNESNIDRARTLAVNIFVIVEAFYLFNCRSLKKTVFEIGFFSNWWLIFGVLLTLFLQLFFTYHPFMHFLFHSVAIGIYDWLIIMFVGFFAYIIVEIRKLTSS